MSDGSHTARKPWPWTVSTGFVVRGGQEFGPLRVGTNVLGAMPIPTYEGRRTYFFLADVEPKELMTFGVEAGIQLDDDSTLEVLGHALAYWAIAEEQDPLALRAFVQDVFDVTLAIYALIRLDRGDRRDALRLRAELARTTRRRTRRTPGQCRIGTVDSSRPATLERVWLPAVCRMSPTAKSATPAARLRTLPGAQRAPAGGLDRASRRDRLDGRATRLSDRRCSRGGPGAPFDERNPQVIADLAKATAQFATGLGSRAATMLPAASALA
jgi:hypothetical protein